MAPWPNGSGSMNRWIRLSEDSRRQVLLAVRVRSGWLKSCSVPSWSVRTPPHRGDFDFRVVLSMINHSHCSRWDTLTHRITFNLFSFIKFQFDIYTAACLYTQLHSTYSYIYAYVNTNRKTDINFITSELFVGIYVCITWLHALNIVK